MRRALYTDAGARRLPTARVLDAALRGVDAEALFWWCETQPAGPLYLLPTRELVAALSPWLLELAGAKGRVLEVAAGDGFLAAELVRHTPSLRLRASDGGQWARAAARLSPAERRLRDRIAGVRLGPNVERVPAVAAVRAMGPEVVLASWLPPGPLLSRLVRSPCRYLVEIGAEGGVTGQGAWDWRFAHEAAPPALERQVRCRLDAGGARQGRVTLYLGRLHQDYREERPKPGDWLWQFHP